MPKVVPPGIPDIAKAWVKVLTDVQQTIVVSPDQEGIARDLIEQAGYGHIVSVRVNVFVPPGTAYVIKSSLMQPIKE